MYKAISYSTSPTLIKFPQYFLTSDKFYIPNYIKLYNVFHVTDVI